MNYEKHANVWNETSTEGLKRARMPNHKIAIALRTCHFWQRAQDFVNEHCRNLCVTDWNINDMMSVVVDDDKVHLNFKIPTDNLRSTRHMRDDRIGLVSHNAALTTSNMIIRSEFEKNR